jgi:interferon gamma-inducible protein 30
MALQYGTYQHAVDVTDTSNSSTVETLTPVENLSRKFNKLNASGLSFILVFSIIATVTILGFVSFRSNPSSYPERISEPGEKTSQILRPLEPEGDAATNYDLASTSPILKFTAPDTPTVLTRHPTVSVGIYYESLCITCRHFLANVLWPLWNSPGMQNIIDLHLVPYGNARSIALPNGKYVFECQHGPEECAYTMWQACALRTIDKIEAAVPYIVCLADYSSPQEAEHSCEHVCPVPSSRIELCVKQKGMQIMHEMEALTDEAAEHLHSRPFVLVNGEVVHRSNLVREICARHTGPKPLACRQLQTMVTPASEPLSELEH